MSVAKEKKKKGKFQVPMENGIDQNEVISLKNLNKYICASVIAASIISVIYGYVFAAMAGALLFIKEDLKISELQVEILAGILNASALPGSMAAGRMSDFIGRRYTIIVASLIFLMGSILTGYSPSYPVLMIGRCASGIGAGFALVIAPVYCAEISPPSFRGFLMSVPELSLNLGLLAGYVSSYFFGKMSLRLGWRMMLGVAAIPSLVLAILMLKMVESPRWLVMQGRIGEARKVLLLVSNSDPEAENRLRDIKIAAGIDENCDQDIFPVPRKSRGGAGALKDLFCKPSRSVRRILIAAIGVHLFQHLSGYAAVLLYTPRIFERAGITDNSRLLLATLGMGISKAIFTFIGASFLDRVGRRVLLLISSAGMAVCMLGLSVCLTMAEHSGEKLSWAISFTIVAVCAYAAFMSIGLGPVTWVYSSEIFPLRLRAQGLGTSVVVNRITNVAVIMSFVTIYEKITMGGIFFMFTGTTAVAWWFYYVLLPETKGRSLEDMEAIFGRHCKSSEIQMDKADCNDS